MKDVTVSNDISRIDLNKLQPDRFQSRALDDNHADEQSRQLEESIDKLGLLNEIIVRPVECTSEDYSNEETEFLVVSGSRRMNALAEWGIINIPCKVVEMSDEEAAQSSLTENTVRKELSGREKAVAVLRWYRVLAEGGENEKGLVGEDEEVECPECGTEYSGRQGLKVHIGNKHNNLDEPSKLFLSPHQIHKKIATQWLGDESKYKTVQKLVKVGRLPGISLSLLEDDERRLGKKADAIDNAVGKTKSYEGNYPPAEYDKLASLNQQLVETEKYADDVTRGSTLLNVYEEAVERSDEERTNVDTHISNISEDYENWMQFVPAATAVRFALNDRPFYTEGDGFDSEIVPESKEDLDEMEYPELQKMATVTEEADGRASADEIRASLIEWLDIEDTGSGEGSGNDEDVTKGRKTTTTSTSSTPATVTNSSHQSTTSTTTTSSSGSEGTKSRTDGSGTSSTGNGNQDTSSQSTLSENDSDGSQDNSDDNDGGGEDQGSTDWDSLHVEYDIEDEEELELVESYVENTEFETVHEAGKNALVAMAKEEENNE